jgi:predicted component of type VI protein secretion system
METATERLRVTVDIFDKTAQRAEPLAALTVQEFITAILTEFQGDFDQLGNDPAHYYLAKADQAGAPPVELQPTAPLALQLEDGAHLIFGEAQRAAPSAAATPRHAIYLREPSQGQVFPLQWLPALIGRPHHEQPGAPLPAVDLSGYPTGLRVSRRHAQIVEQGGRYYVESLSPTNPLLVRDGAGNTVQVQEQKQLLQDGDVLILENSGIQLQFLLRA